MRKYKAFWLIIRHRSAVIKNSGAPSAPLLKGILFMTDNEDFLMFQSFLNSEKREKGVFATFYNKSVRTGNIKENGLPEFENKVFVKIRVVNSIDEVDRPADETDIRRFANEYAFFKVKNEKTAKGTPLKQFAFLTPAQIECCECRNIFTIEDLSVLEDEKAECLGLKEQKDLAVEFLEVSKNNKHLSDLKSLKDEILRLKQENESLRAQQQKVLEQ